MPRVGSKRLELDTGAFPVLGRVIEHTPGLAGVISLPGIVVGVPVCVLLAFEFERLGRARVLRWNIQVEFIAQIAERIRDRRLLNEVVPTGIGWAARDPEIR